MQSKAKKIENVLLMSSVAYQLCSCTHCVSFQREVGRGQDVAGHRQGGAPAQVSSILKENLPDNLFAAGPSCPLPCPPLPALLQIQVLVVDLRELCPPRGCLFMG